MKTLLRTTSLIAVTTIALAVLAGPATAAPTERKISISATGTASARPDAVRASFTLSTIAATASEARQAVAAAGAKIRSVLTAAKIPTADLATTSVTLQPEYVYTPDKAPAIVGYRSSQSWNITLRNPDKAGSIIDAVSEAGGEMLSLNYTHPVLLDTEKVYAAARANAVKKAKTKASSYAKLMGVKLGQVLTISESSMNGPIEFPYLTVKDAVTPAGTQIDQGTQDLSVNIQVEWSLR